MNHTIVALDGLHLPVALLWAYSQDENALVPLQVEHLKECQDCVAVLIMCHTCSSVQHVKTKVSAYGMNVD